MANLQIASGNRLQVANLNMAMEIVAIYPSKKKMIFHSYADVPEGTQKIDDQSVFFLKKNGFNAS